MPSRRWQVIKEYLHLVAHEIDQCRASTFIRNVQHIATGHRFKEFARHMYGGTTTRRSHINFADIVLAIRQELSHVIGWKTWWHNHHIGRTNNPRNRCNVSDEVKWQTFIKGCINPVGRINQKHGVPIGR